MKLLIRIYQIIALLILCGFLWGVVIPRLMSAPDSMQVWLGLILLVVSVPMAIYLGNKYVISIIPPKKEIK